MSAPALRDRASSMCERVAAALAPARTRMPAELADRVVLERIDAVVRERAKLLTDALAEV